MYLLFHSLSHPFEDPYDPRPLSHLRNEPKIPSSFLASEFSASTHGEEELEEPFGDVEQAKIIFVRNLWSFRANVFQKSCQESCERFQIHPAKNAKGNSRLKQASRISIARFCNMVLASMDRFSSLVNSSLVFAFLVAVFFDRSMILPDSCVSALWR